MFLSYKIQRNWGTKDNCMCVYLEQVTNNLQKGQTQLPFGRCLEQKQGTVHAPHTTTTKGMGWSPTPPLQPNTQIYLHYYPFRGPYHHPLWEQARDLLLVLATSCYSMSPNKALPNSSSRFPLLKESTPYIIIYMIDGETHKVSHTSDTYIQFIRSTWYLKLVYR